MDYTAFAEAQQRQQQYQSHPAYDPAQPQQVLYDAAAYYAYHPVPNHYGHHPSSAYHYYPYDHSSYQPPHPPPPGADPAAGLTATVPREPSLQIDASRGQYQDHRHPAAPQTQQAAAYSGLPRFTGTMNEAERALAPPQRPRVSGEPAHKRGGRRGRWPSRGGSGRGNFGSRPSKHDVGLPPFHGRGRGRKGRSGGRQNHQSTPDVQLPVAAPASVTKLLPLMEPMLEESQGPSQASALVAQSPTMILRRPLLPIAWCDICRVDCNSLEVLEQHKNGKRHKKTVQKIQEIQAQQKLMVDLQAKYAAKPEIVLQSAEENKGPLLGEANTFQVEREKIASSGEIITPALSFDQVSKADKAVVMPGNISPTILSTEVIEANKSLSPVTILLSEVNEANISSVVSENLPSVAMEMDHKMGSEMQSQTTATQSESSKGGKAGSEAPTSGASDYIDVPPAMGHGKRARMNGYDRRRGPKRKMMRYWRDGMRLKRSEAIGSKTQERQKEQPRVCTLCNVMCHTQAVFECHLSGKKHISRIKRFQGQHTVFGPISVYIPPNQPTARPPQAPEPLFYGLKSHEMLQQEACVGGYGLQLSDQAQQIGEVEVAALGSQSQQNLGQSECTATEGQKWANMHAEGLHNASEIGSKEPSQLPAALASERS